MRIRAAALADAASIASVHFTSWRETYTWLLPPEVIARNTLERREAFWHAILESGSRDVFVADAGGGELVGFACGGAMPETMPGRAPICGYDAYIDALYVLRAWHRRGLGRALLAALATRLRDSGFRSAALHVVAANDAVRFYEHLGARLIHAEPLVKGNDDAGQLAYGWADIGCLLG